MRVAAFFRSASVASALPLPPQSGQSMFPSRMVPLPLRVSQSAASASAMPAELPDLITRAASRCTFRCSSYFESPSWSLLSLDGIDKGPRPGLTTEERHCRRRPTSRVRGALLSPARHLRCRG